MLQDPLEPRTPSRPEKHFLHYREFQRKARSIVSLGFLLLATGGTLYLLGSTGKLGYFDTRIMLIAVILIFGGLSTLVWAYLNGALFPSSTLRDFPLFEETGSSVSDARIQNELAQLRSDLAELRHSTIRGGDNSLALSELRTAVSNEVVSLVEQRLASEAQLKLQVQELRSTFNNGYARLSSALSEINRRGTLNLFIGVVITGLGAAGLGYMVFTAPPLTDLTSILTHYIPRLSTVVFIEVFAFFFLRLYKATLTDSTFYQSELTYLASIDIALQAAMKTNDSSVMAAVISQVAMSRKGSPSPPKAEDFDTKGLAELIERCVKFGLAAKGGK